MGGHFISAFIGVCITKLFGLLPSDERLDQLRWLAGSLSAATAIVVMQITKTTHPPAGATALLAAVSPEVYPMGWYYLPVVLLSSTLVLVSALVINNIQRRYPVFWWEPVIPAVAKSQRLDTEKGIDSPAGT
jgi:CBS-domain-containing membrane protein